MQGKETRRHQKLGGQRWVCGVGDRYVSLEKPCRTAGQDFTGAAVRSCPLHRCPEWDWVYLKPNSRQGQHPEHSYPSRLTNAVSCKPQCVSAFVLAVWLECVCVCTCEGHKCGVCV